MSYSDDFAIHIRNYLYKEGDIDPNISDDQKVFLATLNPHSLRKIKHQTVECCLAALEVEWAEDIFEYIVIPIEGDLLKEINRMRLLKGPMKSSQKTIWDEDIY